MQKSSDVEISENVTFAEMMLKDSVLASLNSCNFFKPSPIQLRAIPVGCCGRDLIIKAKSGTGKTLVFCTIILDRYSPKIVAPQSLIVAPTREIALQIESVLNALGAAFTGFKAISVIGGRDIAVDRKNLNRCRAIVATPGRALHLINNNLLNTQHIKVLVFDEADKLMTADFRPQIHILMKAMPKDRQFISASATYANKLDKMIMSHMRDPIAVSATKDAPALVGVKQFVYSIDTVELNETAASVAPLIQVMLRKVAAIERILSQVPFKQCILFSNSQLRAESFHNYLIERKWTTTELIVGSHEQQHRISTMEKFRQFESRILITSDLLARGIDIENIDLVINVDVPADTSTYLHRIGRCGRFGTVGIAITLAGDKNDRQKLDALLAFDIGDRLTLPDIATMDELDLWNYSPEADKQVNASDGDAEPLSSLNSSTSVITMTGTDSSDGDKSTGEQSNDDLVEKFNYELLEIADLLVNRHDKPEISIAEDICADYQNHVSHADEMDAMEFDSLASYMQHRESSNSVSIEQSPTKLTVRGDEAVTCGANGTADVMADGTAADDMKTACDMGDNKEQDERKMTLQNSAFINVLKADRKACETLNSEASTEEPSALTKDIRSVSEHRPKKFKKMAKVVSNTTTTSQSTAEAIWANVYWTQVHHINKYIRSVH